MQFKNLALSAALCVCPMFADNVLHPGTPVLDRPTLTVLGIQLPITGDDNFNASVTVQYRQTGTTAWSEGLPLFRVHPNSTVLYTVQPQFAGSIFDLRPGTSYDIQLNATDPDGPVNQTFNLTASTRPVPKDPPSAKVVNVSSASALSSAVNSAQPGTVIQLANGIYSGPFYFQSSGTAQNPIVIRGSDEENTILDGANCATCNVVEVYGGYIHLENMTIQNAQRAVRFFNNTTGNVMRYVHIKNTIMGVTAYGSYNDMYIADNTLEGRLTWPLVYAADNGLHASDDGINLQGFGNVIAHNRISGFGDAMKTSLNGARADDFYGNEILYSYDNGIELDASEGNTRCFRNRFTNTWDTISVQPILGGPAYIFRNIVVNAADEQMKFHAVNTNPPQEPNGVLVYHNTFVSPKGDLYLCTPNTSHHFWIENNLFVGPAVLANKAVMWCGPVDDGHFDYDGYWPDGGFSFNLPSGSGYAYFNWPSFAAMQAGGLETHGTLLPGLIFANGLIGPPTYQNLMAPQDVTLAAGSKALDRGLVLPNINDGFTGSAPDLGALESGCPEPVYGPRPVGMDETNEPLGCASKATPVPVTPIPVVVGISINPLSTTLSAGESQTFGTTITGTTNSAVNWSINPSNIGTLANGVYKAPASITSTQQLTITATSQADPTKWVNAMITLQPPAAPPPPVTTPPPTPPTVRVIVSPAFPSVSPSGSVQFTARVIGSTNSAVRWLISPPVGQISSTGLYTAPSKVASTMIITVTATSLANTSDSTSTAILLN